VPANPQLPILFLIGDSTVRVREMTQCRLRMVELKTRRGNLVAQEALRTNQGGYL
jgi:hypothetical protein